MVHDFAAALGRALGQTRAGDPAEATRTIQAALAGRPGPAQSRDRKAAPGAARPERAHRGHIEDAEIVDDRPSRRSVSRPDASSAPGARPGTGRGPLREVVDLLRRGRGGQGPMRAAGAGRSTPPAIPEGARYETRSFSCAAGSRDYGLYVPAALADGPLGLILMLHGCTQNANDFARGTGMNRVAERHGLIVAYPEQTRGHNA